MSILEVVDESEHLDEYYKRKVHEFPSQKICRVFTSELLYFFS
jgi:hypothetical protein